MKLNRNPVWERRQRKMRNESTLRSKSAWAVALLTLLLLCLTSNTTARAQGTRAVVLTWNVHGSTSPNTPIVPRDLSAVKRQLQQLQSLYNFYQAPIDVYTFQELYVTQAYELAAALNIPADNVHFYGTKPNYNYLFGNAIISRLSPVRTSGEGKSTDWLTLTGDDYELSHEYNLLCGASVRLANGQKLRVYTAHLMGDHSRSDKRANNALYAWRQLADASVIIGRNRLPYPSVVTGDFNIHPPTASRGVPNTPPPASPYDPAYTRLNYLAMIWLGYRDLWAEWSPRNGYPYELTAPGLGKRVDYVVTRDTRVKVLSMYVPNTGAESDHRPMIAYLSF
jgi:endonuclease/exonuclease/phosphatase family metal-dependent hydrolase